MTTTRLILLLLMAIELGVYGNQQSVLERYEERLNSALSKRTGVPRTVKRYKCVEEYVTYDQHGRQVTAYQGSKFTTTMEPPTYRTYPEREIRRKPAKKVTIAINRGAKKEETTTPLVVTSTENKETTTSSLKPFDEMNDEEADRIIEEMYLKKKESHSTESPEAEVAPQIVTESPKPLPPPPPPPSSLPKPPQRSYSTSSSSSSNSAVQRYKQNKIDEDNEDEDYPSSLYHRGSRKRPYDMSTYDDYDDIPLYRPMRREYRMRRRRPILFSDEFSDDSFDQRSNPRRQTTRDLSPLRSLKTLRHIPSYNSPQYRPPGPPPPMSLPVSASTNMIQRPMPVPMASAPGRFPAPPGPMMGMPPMGPPLPMAPPHPLQPIQQQQSLNPGGDDVLKMKPILQANPQEMQVATEESCAKITKLAKSFSIKDVSKWARSNCQFLQMYAPTASCELIFHFIDSCRKNKFF
ncbi:unnamed protein product [Caenorhabditis brenneri]